MKILHVAQPLDAGVPRVVADLAVDQARRGWEVVVAAPPGSELWDTVGDDVRTVAWKAGRSPGPGVFSEVRRIKKILGTERPDIAHLHSSKAGLAGRLALRGRSATVFQPHSWSFEALTGPARALAIAWERRSAKWTDSLVCVSRAEVEVGRSKEISAPYAVVPNGLDLDLWPEPGGDERAEARATLGLAAGDRIAICVGRLSRQKGQDVLLEAWRRIVETIGGGSLYLVGDGPKRADLERAAPAGVTFLGTRGDVRTWMVAADVVVMPSRWEGMSLALLEACATARCVIATDVPGAGEVLGADAGVIVPVEDAQALHDALRSALGDKVEADSMGSRARATVAANFTIERTRERIAAIYEQVLDRRRSYR